MDYRDTPEEAVFRQSLRAWLAGNTIEGWKDIPEDDIPRFKAMRKQWQRMLYDAGYLALTWPVEYGGRGQSPTYEAILNEEVGRASAPPLPGMINYLGRAIFTYGTEEQKLKFLPSLLNGDIQWCQGFSEPSAGSDLASLRTRAVRDGDHYVVNGQKMWTSGAIYADWCLLLVRTDTEVPKHKGISCLLMPMDSPGVTARPIYLHSGSPETAEVFLDDVRVPVENRIGAEGDGWRLAMTTVSFERGAADVGFVANLGHQLEAIKREIIARDLVDDVAIRRRLAQAYVDARVLTANVARQLSMRVSGRDPGPEGSVGKLLWSRAAQGMAQLGLDVVGADALTGRESEWLSDYFTTRPTSVYGGSSQIQKNILARMLDMPRQ